MVAVGIPGATPFGGHTGRAFCLAFSPDGATFASGGSDGTVRIWNTATRQQIAQFAGHLDRVRAVAYSPDGGTLAAASLGGVSLWNTATGDRSAVFPVASEMAPNTAAQLQDHEYSPEPVRVSAVAYSADGRTLALGCHDGTVRLWDVASGQQIALFDDYADSVLSVGFRPMTAVLASTDGRFVRLRCTDPVEPGVLLTTRAARVDAMAYSSDGRLLAVADGLDVYEHRPSEHTGQAPRARVFPHASAVNAVSYVPGDPSGLVLATGDVDGDVHLWNTRTGRHMATLTGHSGEVRAMACSPDGALLITAGGQDRTIRLWDISARKQVDVLSGHISPVTAVAYAPDGGASPGTLATGGDDGVVRLWNAGTGEEIAQLAGHAQPVRAIAYSPDGTTIATADGGSVVRLWDAVTRSEAQQLSMPGPVLSLVREIAYSPDGNSIATVGSDRHARIWNAATGEQTAELTAERSYAVSVTWRPDGGTVVTGHVNGFVRLWNAATGEMVAEQPALSSGPGPDLIWMPAISGHRYDVRVAHHPRGETFACGGGDGTVRLWNTRTLRSTAPLAGHQAAVLAVAYSPDGRSLASADGRGIIRLWDSATGQQRAQLTGHTKRVNGLAFSPDGSMLASVGDDGTIRIWNPRNSTLVNGTGFGAPRTRRPLAGVRSDSPTEQDLLGVGADVETLAELIAATETRPPLAIALIGDWGAGKSSVMLQVERQIDLLAERARNNPGLSAFAENVRQVRFNAWHYSDDQLWTGLVSHLFGVLAAPGSAHGDWDTTGAADQRSVAAERERLQAELATQQAAADKLAASLNRAEGARQPPGGLAGLGSPLYSTRVLLAAARQVVSDVRAGVLVLLGWLILGLAAYMARPMLEHWDAAITAVSAALIPPVAAVVGKLRAGHEAIADFTDLQRSALTARQQEYQQEIQSLQDRLVLVDAAARLARFLGERGSEDAYRRYRGLLGQVHADLSRLSVDLADARTEWAAAGGYSAPPLERIVLYIDDLDRCPPRRVVEMLEAVHLMLALDLFVVVVAVDARWLIRSLEYRHQALFGQDDHEENEPGNPDTAGPAAPIDYLDKIFQIPYVLVPPTPDATAGYLRALLPQPAPAPWAEPASQGGDAETGRDPAAPTTAQPGRGPQPNPHRSEAADRATETVTAETPGLIGAVEAMTVELRPQGLVVSTAEVEFMARLGGLTRTPRAAKRLVNIYRLVRISVPERELAAFAQHDGPHKAVQVLLAMLVGYPEVARKAFRAVLEGTRAGDLAAVVAEVADDSEATHSFGMIGEFLTRVRAETGVTVTIEECRRWCPQLARFSFYTRELAGDYLHVAARPPLADVDLGGDPLAEFGNVADDVNDAAAGAEAV